MQESTIHMQRSGGICSTGIIAKHSSESRLCPIGQQGTKFYPLETRGPSHINSRGDNCWSQICELSCCYFLFVLKGLISGCSKRHGSTQTLVPLLLIRPYVVGRLHLVGCLRVLRLFVILSTESSFRLSFWSKKAMKAMRKAPGLF